MAVRPYGMLPKLNWFCSVSYSKKNMYSWDSHSIQGSIHFQPCQFAVLKWFEDVCVWMDRMNQSMHYVGIFTYQFILFYASVYDLVPKGAQEKRTEVLENKVDRMWVSNAFFWMNTVKSSTSEGRRQCCSLFLRNLTFSMICDKMLNITHYNKPTSLCC